MTHTFRIGKLGPYFISFKVENWFLKLQEYVWNFHIENQNARYCWQKLCEIVRVLCLRDIGRYCCSVRFSFVCAHVGDIHML